ncbi:integrase core domain-containing protein [Stenotrophomonas sp. Sm6012]|uniref:integrase core domain-containing protein n=1 Tax=Stenotrophomonas sp. Sm6012 TaxID=3002745 RepID=UPI0018ED320F|nr:integrase core domain-containing protein [Stenotrophomonas sp. Sm6012]MDQ7282709.1 integrase core domain-containing protein [Stenotrophomonas sp. Sm6012]
MKQEFITRTAHQQNRMVERMIRTLKEQCVHRHRFESQAHALWVVADRIAFYNQPCPHQALKMMTTGAAYADPLIQ